MAAPAGSPAAAAGAGFSSHFIGGAIGGLCSGIAILGVNWRLTAAARTEALRAERAMVANPLRRGERGRKSAARAPTSSMQVGAS
jgi:hypothetical protein